MPAPMSATFDLLWSIDGSIGVGPSGIATAQANLGFFHVGPANDPRYDNSFGGNRLDFYADQTGTNSLTFDANGSPVVVNPGSVGGVFIETIHLLPGLSSFALDETFHVAASNGTRSHARVAERCRDCRRDRRRTDPAPHDAAAADDRVGRGAAVREPHW
jgi:hypothetical protein